MKKNRELLRSVVFLAQFLMFSAMNTNAQLLADERQPIPSQENQQAAQEEIRDFYKTEFQEARSASNKSRLAQQLMTDAMAVEEDSSARYALLRMAQDLSNETKNLELGLEIADSMASSFTISQSRARAEVILSFAQIQGKIERGQRIALANESLKLVDSLLDERHFDLAKKMVNIASDSARKARDFVFFRRARAIGKDLDSMVAEQKKLRMTEGENANVKKTEKDGVMRPFVVGTRVEVQYLVKDHEWHGIDPEEIARGYDNVSIAQVYAALAYSHDNRDEVRQMIREDESAIQRLQDQLDGSKA